MTDNKIASVDELNNIDCLQSLHEVSFAGNPVTHRQHRAILVATQPNIQLIDGVPVSIDERADAEAMLDAAFDIPEYNNSGPSPQDYQFTDIPEKNRVHPGSYAYRTIHAQRRKKHPKFLTQF